MDGGATEIIGGGSPEDLEGDLEGWWNDPGIAVWSFVLFGCFLLNVTLLLAFLARPGLRTISNRFVMNLTVSNLLTCAILNPLLIVDAPGAPAVTAATPSSEAPASSARTVGGICAISEAATALVTTSSVLSVFLIAVDQYYAVVDPLRYRARVDKFKSGILIVSVWLISAAFGILASLNPRPRSVWLSCALQQPRETAQDRSLSFDSTIVTGNLTARFNLLGNRTVSDLVGEISAISSNLEAAEAVDLDNGIDLLQNASANLTNAAGQSIDYGLVYAIVQSVFGYLLPFAGVCWIYVSIYSAAHRNSERTRRTGSRPILSSSASFCEEQYAAARQHHQPQQYQQELQQQQQQLQLQLQLQQQQQQQQQQQKEAGTMEEFRRIPKISSLSSIDETSETTQPSYQAHRTRSLSSSSDILRGSLPVDEGPPKDVVFTVGSRRIEVSPRREEIDADDEEKVVAAAAAAADRPDRIPVAILKAEFLEKDNAADRALYEDLIKSKFHDRPDRRRKSSHDLMYEEMLTRMADGRNAKEDALEVSSESEDEGARVPSFDTLEVPGPLPEVDCNEEHLLSFSSYVTDSSLTVDFTRSVGMAEESMYENVNANREMVNHRGTSGPESCEAASGIATVLANRGKSRSEFRYQAGSDGRTGRRPSVTLCTSDVLLNMPISHDSSSSNPPTNGIEPSSCLLTPIVTITPAPNRSGTLQRVSSVRSTSSYINSLKHRISNGSLFRYREETRAARISALVIVMALICWSPYVILLVVKNLPVHRNSNLPHEYDVLALALLILAAYVSPLLFGYRSRRVKRELRKFFCFRRELSYKNNRSLMAKKVLKRRHSSTLSHLEIDHKYNIFNCVYGRSRWPKEKVQFVQVPDTALAVETCRSSFSSGASTQISTTSTEEC